MDVARYEVNRQVRVVLSKHNIDLTMIDYSFIGGTVYLSGELHKTIEDDISPPAIEDMAKEIAGLTGVRDVQFDLQNWNISAAGNSWQITKSKKKLLGIGVPATGKDSMAEAAKDVHIRTSERIEDVLKDMKKKPEQEDRQ